MSSRKQRGVRNLDVELGPRPSQGRPYEEPPVPVACKHRNRIEMDFYRTIFVKCEDCGQILSER